MVRATVVTTGAAMAAYGVTLVQQVLYARTLGVTAEVDALAVALAWAIATSGLIGTTLQSVILPRYSAALVADQDAARATSIFRSASAIGLALGATFAVVTLAGAPALAGVLLPRSEAPTVALLVTLLRLTAPLHLTWVAVWLCLTLTNAHERFVLAALSPILAAVPVLATLVLVPAPSVELVGSAYLIGTVLQVGALLVGTARWARDLVPALARRTLSGLAAPLLGIGVAILLMNVAGLALRALASALEAGDVAAVDYASRLSLAAQQLLITGLTAVALTRWSRQGAGESLQVSMGRTFPVVIDVAMLLAVAMMTIGTDAIGVLFGAGRFTAGDVATVGQLLVWMGPGIAGQMVTVVALRGVLAVTRTTWVVAVGLVSLGSTLLVGAGSLGLGLPGIGAAYSAAWVLASIAALAGLHGLVRFGSLAASAVRSLVVAVVVAIAIEGALSFVAGSHAARLVVGGAVGVGVAAACGLLLGTATARFLLAEWSARAGTAATARNGG